jgi:hypothetical protein
VIDIRQDESGENEKHIHRQNAVEERQDSSVEVGYEFITIHVYWCDHECGDAAQSCV